MGLPLSILGSRGWAEAGMAVQGGWAGGPLATPRALGALRGWVPDGSFGTPNQFFLAQGRPFFLTGRSLFSIYQGTLLSRSSFVTVVTYCLTRPVPRPSALPSSLGPAAPSALPPPRNMQHPSCFDHYHIQYPHLCLAVMQMASTSYVVASLAAGVAPASGKGRTVFSFSYRRR